MDERYALMASDGIGSAGSWALQIIQDGNGYERRTDRRACLDGRRRSFRRDCPALGATHLRAFLWHARPRRGCSRRYSGNVSGGVSESTCVPWRGKGLLMVASHSRQSIHYAAASRKGKKRERA